MTDPRLDVLCIGNAIVDVIADASDEFLHAEGLTKGTMRSGSIRTWEPRTR